MCFQVWYVIIQCQWVSSVLELWYEFMSWLKYTARCYNHTWLMYPDSARISFWHHKHAIEYEAVIKNTSHNIRMVFFCFGFVTLCVIFFTHMQGRFAGIRQIARMPSSSKNIGVFIQNIMNSQSREVGFYHDCIHLKFHKRYYRSACKILELSNNPNLIYLAASRLHEIWR